MLFLGQILFGDEIDQRNFMNSRTRRHPPLICSPRSFVGKFRFKVSHGKFLEDGTDDENLNSVVSPVEGGGYSAKAMIAILLCSFMKDTVT